MRLFPELGVDDPIPPADRFAREIAPSTIVAEQSGRTVGYVYFQRLAPTGYVRHVVVEPAARGTRLGRALLLAAAAEIRSVGGTRWCLNVKPENERARRLYERLGMRAVHTSTALRLDWALVDRLPPDPPGVAVEPLAPSDDAAVEHALGLLAGQLADARAKPERFFFAARSGGAWRGVAVLDPALPGMYPLRAGESAMLAALFRVARGHAAEGVSQVSTVVEGDEALAQVLLDAGATLRLHIVHYAGDIPGASGPAPAAGA